MDGLCGRSVGFVLRVCAQRVVILDNRQTRPLPSLVTVSIWFCHRRLQKCLPGSSESPLRRLGCFLRHPLTEGPAASSARPPSPSSARASLYTSCIGCVLFCFHMTDGMEHGHCLLELKRRGAICEEGIGKW